MNKLPDSVKKLIEAKAYANVATLMPDGSPQVTQTWVDYDENTVLINTYEGSQKHRNVLRNPKIAFDIVDPKNPYNLAVTRGRVIEGTFDGAENHLAERVRRVGGTTIRSIGHISELQTIDDDNNEAIPAGEMVRRLMEDNAHIAMMVRNAIPVCDRNRDSVTSNLLQDILDQTERRKWFLFEIIQGMSSTE